jgi:flavin reductase (DIM6/NTAB) family NADH-FMN oxidoreductase RutF
VTQHIEAQQLRHALGHFTTGVTVVTTVGLGGEPVGTTASAVSALSLDPPLVLVCLARTSETLAELSTHRRFAVNVLAEDQRHISENFARSGEQAVWDEIDHRTGPGGAPRLEGALAVLDCELEQSVPGGDHEIVVGRIRELELGQEDVRPLIHFRGAYGALAGP